MEPGDNDAGLPAMTAAEMFKLYSQAKEQQAETIKENQQKEREKFLRAVLRSNYASFVSWLDSAITQYRREQDKDEDSNLEYEFTSVTMRYIVSKKLKHEQIKELLSKVLAATENE